MAADSVGAVSIIKSEIKHIFEIKDNAKRFWECASPRTETKGGWPSTFPE
jgi:hypothetical protein